MPQPVPPAPEEDLLNPLSADRSHHGIPIERQCQTWISRPGVYIKGVYWFWDICRAVNFDAGNGSQRLGASHRKASIHQVLGKSQRASTHGFAHLMQGGHARSAVHDDVVVDIHPFPEGDAERTDAPDKWFDNDSIDSVKQLSRYYLEAESVRIEERRRGCSGSGYRLRKLPRGG